MCIHVLSKFDQVGAAIDMELKIGWNSGDRQKWYASSRSGIRTHTESTTRSLISGWYDVGIEFMPSTCIFQHGAKKDTKNCAGGGIRTHTWYLPLELKSCSYSIYITLMMDLYMDGHFTRWKTSKCASEAGFEPRWPTHWLVLASTCRGCKLVEGQKKKVSSPMRG